MQVMSRTAIVALLTALLYWLAPAVHAQSFPPEVNVAPPYVTDFEFDWGRDGEYCASCNFGDGNNRLTFIDPFSSVWIGHVDVTTGDFVPANGEGTLVDINGVPSVQIGNGSEFVNLQQASALVYTRFNGGMEAAAGQCVGFANFDVSLGMWTGGCIPGTQGYTLPIGTLNVGDPYPMVSYQNSLSFGEGFNVYWQLMSRQASPQVVLTGSRAPPARRWIPNTHAMVLVAAAPPDASGKVYRQVFLYQTDDGTLQQITFDPVNKNSPFMWAAPEFDNEFIFLQTPQDASEIDIYRNLPNGTGTSSWKVIKRIQGTPDFPYIYSPEPFVYQGKSWIFFELDAAPHHPDTYPASQIAMAGIDPDMPSFRMLTTDVPPSIHARRDPEYYITRNGPYIYYNRVVPAPPGGQAVSEGVFRVDAGLGPSLGPSGSRAPTGKP